MRLTVFAEAAYQLSDDARVELPDIPWNDIIGMRHRLVHAYFDLNLDILWQTAQDDIPAVLDPHLKAFPE